MRRFLLCGIFAITMTIGGLLLPGCTDTPPATTGPDTTSTNKDVTLTPPDSGNGFQIVIDPFDVPAGQEVIKNVYKKIPLDAEAYVSLIQIVSNTGGRNVNVYKSDMADVADHVEDTFDPVPTDTWDLLCASLQEKYTWKLASFSAFRLAPHQQMNFQVHYLNTGTTTIRGKVVINVWTTIEKKDIRYTVGLLHADNENIKVPPHTSATYCKVMKPFDQEIQIMVMAGSFHSHGKRLAMGPWDGKKMTDTLYTNASWEKPTIMDLACGTTVHAGDSLAIITTFENPTDTEISFGPRLLTEEESSFYLYFSQAPTDGRTIYDFKNGFLMESHPL